jgi:hypothetical protein
MLTERRLSGKSQPFRCPSSTYKALVAAMAASESAMAIDEIMTAAAKHGGDRPGDFQVRVVLRLWTHAEPPLVVRNRARYRAAEPTSFLRLATNLWKLLKP